MVARIDGTPYKPGGNGANATAHSGSTSNASTESTAAQRAVADGMTLPEAGPA
jgi:hypothetical protein